MTTALPTGKRACAHLARALGHGDSFPGKRRATRLSASTSSVVWLPVPWSGPALLCGVACPHPETDKLHPQPQASAAQECWRRHQADALLFDRKTRRPHGPDEPALLSRGARALLGACCSVAALAYTCAYTSAFPRAKMSGSKQPGCSLGTRPRLWWLKPFATSRSPSGSTSEQQSWKRTSAPRSGFFGKVSPWSPSGRAGRAPRAAGLWHLRPQRGALPGFTQVLLVKGHGTFSRPLPPGAPCELGHRSAAQGPLPYRRAQDLSRTGSGRRGGLGQHRAGCAGTSCPASSRSPGGGASRQSRVPPHLLRLLRGRQRLRVLVLRRQRVPTPTALRRVGMRAGAPAPPGASAETELLWQVRRVRPRTVGRRHSLSPCTRPPGQVTLLTSAPSTC